MNEGTQHNDDRDEQVTSRYRRAMAHRRPDPDLDRLVLRQAAAGLGERGPTRARWRLFGLPLHSLAWAALVVITVGSLVAVFQNGDPDWQPVGTGTAKPPAALPPVPAIEAPTLIPPGTSGLELCDDADGAPSCPDDDISDPSLPTP